MAERRAARMMIKEKLSIVILLGAAVSLVFSFAGLSPTSSNNMFIQEALAQSQDTFLVCVNGDTMMEVTESEYELLVSELGAHQVSRGDCNEGSGSETEQSDADEDGILDAEDNCPSVPNSSQQDRNGDGIGDECDKDMDSVPDAEDNCPSDYNPNQFDSDGNGVGDACDNFTPSTNPNSDKGIQKGGSHAADRNKNIQVDPLTGQPTLKLHNVPCCPTNSVASDG